MPEVAPTGGPLGLGDVPEQIGVRTMSHDLERVAATLVADRKGPLAADETVPTLTKRFDTLGIPSAEQSRRSYRWVPAVRRIAASGATTDINMIGGLGIRSTEADYV